MHTHIYNAQEEAEMKLSCIRLKRKKESVMYINGGCVMADMNIQKSCLIMEETL